MAKTKNIKKISATSTTNEPKVVAQISVLGKIFKGEGKTVSEALTALKPQGVPRGKSILIVSKGDKSKERVLNPLLTSKLFSPSRIAREIALKNTAMLFDL